MGRIFLISSLVGLSFLLLSTDQHSAAQGAALTPGDHEFSVFASQSIWVTPKARVEPQSLVTSGLNPAPVTTTVGATLGTFTYTIPPGDTIASAILSGSFTDNRPRFSPAISFTLDSFAVGSSAAGTFSFTIPVGALSSLADGSSTLAFTSGTALNYTYTFSNLLLTVNTVTPVPEPSVIPGLLLFGLLGSLIAAFKVKQVATDSISAIR